MSIMPKRGACLHCGHDHGDGLGSPHLLSVLKANTDNVNALESTIAELRAAIAQKEAAAPGGEVAAFWVLERTGENKHPEYWDGGSSQSFVSDVEKCVHFCRKEDAFWACRGWRGADTKLTEHMMLARAALAQPVAVEVPTDLYRLHDAAIEAVEKWVCEEHLSTKIMCAGGQARERKLTNAESKARSSILRLMLGRVATIDAQDGEAT